MLSSIAVLGNKDWVLKKHTTIYILFKLSRVNKNVLKYYYYVFKKEIKYFKNEK